MQQVKETSVAVCWRIKESNLSWLRSTAQQQERSVSWLINKLIEQSKPLTEAAHGTPT